MLKLKTGNDFNDVLSNDYKLMRWDSFDAYKDMILVATPDVPTADGLVFYGYGFKATKAWGNQWDTSYENTAAYTSSLAEDHHLLVDDKTYLLLNIASSSSSGSTDDSTDSMINVLKSSHAITLDRCKVHVEVDFAEIISLKDDAENWMEAPNDRVWISFDNQMPTDSDPTTAVFTDTIIGIENFAVVKDTREDGKEGRFLCDDWNEALGWTVEHDSYHNVYTSLMISAKYGNAKFKTDKSEPY